MISLYSRKRLNLRLAAALTAIAAILIIFVLTIYSLQAAAAGTEQQQSGSTYTVTTTVPAARGAILDRNGVVLASDSEVFNVTFDTYALLGAANPNAVLLDLINIVGVENCTDSLPISSPPFEYTDKDDNFSAFLKYKNLERNVSAEDFMAILREKYNVGEEYSDEDARRIIGIRYELDLRYASSNLAQFVLVKNISSDIIAQIKERGYAGVIIQVGTVTKVYTPYASQIIGRVGLMDKDEYNEYGPLGWPMDAEVGKDGTQRAFEEYLHGSDGSLNTTYSDTGSVIDSEYTKTPEPGKNVVLTLDIGLQETAETSLAECIEKLREKDAGSAGAEAGGGAAVVIDVKTGEILTAANYPTYSIATFNQDYDELIADKYNPMFNRAFQGTYPPGSTFKMVTATAGLEDGIIAVDTEIEDKGIYTYYKDANYTPMCWIYSSTGTTHGFVNVAEALEVSCNYFFYELGRLTKIDEIDRYATLYGLGQKTGVELSESTGILAGPDNRELSGGQWYGGDTIQAAIGQSDNTTTPLQLATYIATLANGGTRYSSHLLKSVLSSDYSSVFYESAPEVLSTVGMSQTTYDTISSGMLAVSKTGTAAEIFSDYPINVCSKTGSAQTSTEADNGVFVCYAPYEDPEIAIAVVVEGGGQGGLVASVAKDIMNYYFAEPSSGESVSENELLGSN